MDEIEKIRKRLSKTEKKSKGKLYTFFMSVFCLMSLTLGFLIYAKHNPNGSVFGINLASINEKFNKTLGNIFTLNIFSKGDKTVDASVKYFSLGDDLYNYDDESIPSLKEGTVTYTSKQDGKYFVLLAYDNGVTASYFNVSELLVKVQDRLKPGDIIGSYEDSFKVIFVRGESKVTYEDACK